MTFREATHQVQVLALDVAILWQLAYKPLDRRQQLWRQDSDDMSPLLRAHCEWPGGHGAADQRDECASLHVLPPSEGNTLPHRDAALCSTAKAIAEWSKWVKTCPGVQCSYVSFRQVRKLFRERKSVC